MSMPSILVPMSQLTRRKVPGDRVRQSLSRKDSGTTDKGFERARAILGAARDILTSGGFAALSMRGVAARVGVNLSTVQHYYKSKEALLEALLVYTMESYQTAIDDVTAAMRGASRLRQFEAAIDTLIAIIRQPDTGRLFVEVWALASHNLFAARIVEDVQARERKAMFRLIRGLSPQIGDREYEARAALIAAQIDGLMLRIARPGGERREVAALVAAARRLFVAIATDANTRYVAPQEEAAC